MQQHIVVLSNNMRILICLLAAVTLTTGHKIIAPSVSEFISNAVIAEIKRIREQMPYGFPNKGIPPLAPLVSQHRDVNYNQSNFKLIGPIDNFTLNGLNDFETVDMKVDVFARNASFSFLFNHIYLHTLYDFKLFFKKAGFTINMIGNGPAKLSIKDIQISGNTKYTVNTTLAKIHLHSLNVRTQIGEVESDVKGVLGVYNSRFNDFLGKAITESVNENENFISHIIKDKILPIINKILDKAKWRNLDDRKGDGGNGGVINETIICKPKSRR